MRVLFLIAQIIFFALVFMGANSSYVLKKKPEIKSEIRFLELKYKKELSDKRLTPQKKYLFAILAAREFRFQKAADIALEFYKMAKDIRVDENKTEVLEALSRKNKKHEGLFFYEVNLKTLVKNRQYEKAILAIDPDKLIDENGKKLKIVYDLLNVKLRKRAVKHLYCYDELQKDPDDYQFANLFCDLLTEYLREGKFSNDHIKVIEEYFFKHDLEERYLLQVVKELQN